MRILISLLLFCPAFLWAKEMAQIEVKAVHAVTHEARDGRAITEKGVMGAHSVGRQVESFDLDAIIKGKKTVLICDDDKGCEAPSLGTHNAELWPKGHVRVIYDVPVTHKEVKRWYRIAGRW